MIRNLHALRKHEEGQALVLATITMLILALCLLATINLTYAVDQKIRLQNTADAAAYTTAAYEARTLNFLAYTNRAMIVQYASQMNLMAMTSYFSFNLALLGMLTYLAQSAGAASIILFIVAIIVTIAYYIYLAITWLTFLITAAAVPLMDASNYGMSFAQYAVVHSIADSASSPNPVVTSGPLAEVNSADPQHPGIYSVTNLSQMIPGANDAERWFTSAGTNMGGTMVQISPWAPETVDYTTGQQAYDRLSMVELVNAARTSWTAYGNGNWTFGIPRQFQYSFFIGAGGFGIGLYVGKSARTEWGALAPGARTPGGVIGSVLCDVVSSFLNANPCTPTEEHYSLDRFALILTVEAFGITIQDGLSLDSYAYADRGTVVDSIAAGINSLLRDFLNIPTGLAQIKWSHSVGFNVIQNQSGGGGFFGKLIVDAIQAILKPVLSALASAANQFLAEAPWPSFPPNWIPLWHFGMVPYAAFRPTPEPGGFPSFLPPSAAQLFNQPPVLMMVSVPASQLLSLGQPFMGSSQGWGFQIGGLSSAGTPNDESYRSARNTTPSREGYVNKLTFLPYASNALGLPLPANMASGGMMAVSAGMAYYHRPGDWREPPNLFNPMWGAKLMPVSDYPNISQALAMNTVLTADPNTTLVVH